MWRVAVLLLAVIAAGPRVSAGAEPETAGTVQEEKLFEREITVTARLKYLLALPAGYESGTDRWPLLVFLHGAGESGDDLGKVKAHGPPKLIAAGDRAFPCIVVSPQSPGRGWNPDVLAALVDEICRDYRVDEDRIWLTGLSMGGFGTWALAAAKPDRFAAIVPICGGGNPSQADKLLGIPTWVFHGAKDFVVPLASSQQIVDAIREKGGEPKFTVYPEAGHDSWTETYADPALWDWLFAQSRGHGQSESTPTR
ncbi:MAG: PHB depolymerase family esterase [Planctomycetia bacterium]